MKKIVRCIWWFCIICMLNINIGCGKNVNDAELVLSSEEEKVEICVNSLQFERTSRTQIKLLWEKEQDSVVDRYIVKRRILTKGKRNEPKFTPFREYFT